jgi:hypothetical protein
VFALFSKQKFQHERKLYDMFSNNNTSKNVRQIGSCKSSLQDRGFEGSYPPSKKPRVDDNCALRQARSEDDEVWGEDLDANTVEECFILASQALSQVCYVSWGSLAKISCFPKLSPDKL